MGLSRVGRGALAVVRTVASAVVASVDLRDLHVYGGLALGTWGGWQVSPPWTAVAVGSVLLGLGLFLPSR